MTNDTTYEPLASALTNSTTYRRQAEAIVAALDARYARRTDAGAGEGADPYPHWYAGTGPLVGTHYRADSPDANTVRRYGSGWTEEICVPEGRLKYVRRCTAAEAGDAVAVPSERKVGDPFTLADLEGWGVPRVITECDARGIDVSHGGMRAALSKFAADYRAGGQRVPESVPAAPASPPPPETPRPAAPAEGTVGERVARGAVTVEAIGKQGLNVVAIAADGAETATILLNAAVVPRFVANVTCAAIAALIDAALSRELADRDRQIAELRAQVAGGAACGFVPPLDGETAGSWMPPDAERRLRLMADRVERYRRAADDAGRTYEAMRAEAVATERAACESILTRWADGWGAGGPSRLVKQLANDIRARGEAGSEASRHAGRADAAGEGVTSC